MTHTSCDGIWPTANEAFSRKIHVEAGLFRTHPHEPVYRRPSRFVALVILAWLLIGCQSPAAVVGSPIAGSADILVEADDPGSTPTTTPAPTEPPPPSPTARPTSTPRIPFVAEQPTVTVTYTPSATPTPTPIGPCSERIPADDLLILVTLEYGLGRGYAPRDLVPLSNYLPTTITLGYPTEIRRVIVGPLVLMINQMLADGLQPTIISGYRSYQAQGIAWSKWLEKEPERVSIISAPPGHSEHQLGTTVDFGSPELAEIVEQEDVEFHTYFYKTSEGEWLAEHAHEYGFTLSYPREAMELTGFFYEPWHYRYVGPELARELKEQGVTLTQYLFDHYPLPCIP